MATLDLVNKRTVDGWSLSVYRACVFVVPSSFANPTCIKLLRERLTLSSLIHLSRPQVQVHRSWNLATLVPHLLDQVRWGHHAQAFVKIVNYSYFGTSQLLLGIYSGINV